MTQVRPTLAAAPASEEAALPVEAQATTRARRASARATPTTLARSLKEAVGLRPSSFRTSERTPAQSARRRESRSGVQPGSMGGSLAAAGTGSSSR